MAEMTAQPSKNTSIHGQQQQMRPSLKSGEGPRAKTAGEMGVNVFRQTFSQGRQTQQGRKREKISKAQWIEVTPQEITFQDIELNQIYEAYIYVRNLTQIPRRVRIQQPQTSRFRVDYDAQGALAAGLAMKLVLQFETQQMDDFHDSVVIRSDEGFTFEVPIHAMKPQPVFEFPSAVDLGYAKVATDRSVSVTFKNTGKQQGKVVLKSDTPKLKMDPSTLQLSPGTTGKVKITYSSNLPCVYRSEIQVVQSWCSIVRQIDVSCTVVEYSIFFLDQNQALTSMVEFGDLILGNLQCYNGFLVNNTPIKQNWKSIVRKGFHSSLQMEGQLQTPNEVGIEWLEKVIRCQPEKGILEPYASMPIKVDCRGRVTEEDIQRCANYALKPMAENPKQPYERSLDLQYSLFFEFDAEKANEEQMILHISVRQVMPQVKVSKQHLKFGDCAIHDTRDCTFWIENTHREQTIDVSFSRVPQFSVVPERLILPPQIKKEIQVTFRPKNVGKVHQILDVLLIEEHFRVPIQLIGHASYNSERRPITRGPEALPQDFDHMKNFIDDSHIEYMEVKRKQIKSENLLVRQKSLKTMRQQNVMDLFFREDSQATQDEQVQRHQLLSEWEQERFTEKLQQYHQTKENQHKYTQFLRGERASRMQKKRDQILQLRVDQMEEKIKLVQAQTQPIVVGQDPKKALDSDEEDKTTRGNPRLTAPMDYEFQLGMMETGMMEPGLGLPPNQDGLFVTRPIDKYEPLQSANEKTIFKPDPTQPMKKRFPAAPLTHRDIRDINMELQGEELKKIQAGPVEIDFGRVFIKSKITRTFHIKNDLRSSISAQIQTDREELACTYMQPQIIPSSETARFEISLISSKLGPFQQKIRYVINGRHNFDFLVTAQIEPVQLELSKSSFKFAFADDSLNLEVAETLRVTNSGNATAKFKWTMSEQRVFTVSVPEGEVLAGKFIDLQLVYRPANLQLKDDRLPPPPTSKETEKQGNKPSLVTQLVNQQRTDEDKLVIKITDGIEQVVKVSGVVNDARCVLKHLAVDMKDLLVCKPDVKFFSIRNQSRVPAIFKILSEKLPAACDVMPITGKIMPDEQKDVTVRYQAREETDVKTDILILIRGGRVLRIPFQVRTIIPQLEIMQDTFDFGKLTTLGNEGSLRMTLFNHSLIAAELILDLRPEKDNPDAPDGIDCLQIVEAGDNDESVLRSIHEDQNEDHHDSPQQFQSPDDIESEDREDSDKSSEDELDRVTFKKFTLTIGPNQQLEFILKFAPKDVKTYNFELPIQLNRYGKLPGLTRSVVCRGLKPKFLMDPQMIEFARKIITSVEKCFAATVEVVLSNPEKKSVGWRLDTSSINADRVFHIHPVEGKIDPGQTLRLKAQFNPQGPGDFYKQVPVYIDDNDQPKDKPYLELVLKGSAAQPKLLFDRREVLLPVVPLNIDARCTFRVLNDGYENLNLRYKVFGEEGNIQIRLKFPEGQNLGITKRRVRVDAVFQSSKPISFTTRIEFYDDVGTIYTIPISGTTDNCLLTNYSYQQRCIGEFRIALQDQDAQKGAIIIIDDDQDVNSEIGSQPGKGGNRVARRAPSVMSSRTQGSHFSGRSTRSALGYSPIPQDLLIQNKQYVTKWMNFYVFSQNLHSFPESVIEQDGAQVFELVCLLSGKSSLPFQVQLDKQIKKLDRIKLLLTQYDELIRMLKSEGALLNHIRPYHLLCYTDLNFALKMIPKDELDQIHPTVLKITPQRFNYISTDSWCSLFYQIVKIYALARINPKYFRSIPNMPGGDRSNLPDYYTHGSNLYSAQEGVLLRWLEVHNELYQSGGLNQPQQQQQISSTPGQRLMTFDKDLRDGWFLATLIQSYVGQNAAKYFQGMKLKCFLDEDYQANAQKVFKALQEINLQTPFDQHNFSHPSAREMVLLVMHLFNTIVNYIPKGTPVVFQCVLGKECVRLLDIYNPTTKAVSYWVNYEGVPDFTLEGESCFKIEPKTSIKYKIKFISRVSQPVQGRVTFTNKRESSVAAATLVFDLKSQIVGRISEQTHNISTALYETKDFAIQIVNKFTNADFGNFQITLVHERVVKPEVGKKKRQLYPVKEQQQSTEVFPCMFCRTEQVRLKRGQTVSMQLQFIPLVMEQQRCLIIFNDPQVGEFQHEIVGMVELPEQIIDYKAPTVYVDQAVTNDYQIMLKNDAMQKARKNIEQIMLDRKSKKVLNFPGGLPEQTVFEVELSNSQGYVSAPKSFTLNDHHRQKLNQKLQQEQSKLATDQQSTNQQLQTLTVHRTSKVDISKLDQSQLLSTAEMTTQGSNKIPITYMFKNAVRDLVVYMTLKNADKTDVRKYRILINALPKPVKAVMEMVCPAREQVVQEIPIVNPSDREWTIKIQLLSDQNANGTPIFSLLNTAPHREQQEKEDSSRGPIVPKNTNAYKDVVVKRKQTLTLQLVFNPRWITEATGQLTLTNPTTNDIYDYQLKGVAEEPLAECHITLKCQARRTTRKEIAFQNTTAKPITYKVETDVINASGLTQFTIQPGKKYNYILTVTPTLSGQYTGSITFYSDDGEYVWYTILLDTDSPRAEKDIELVTQARKPIAFDIELTNPMQDDQATFEVLINGDNLIGEKYFTVLPGTSSTYELIYLPLLPGKDKAQIGFIHGRLGEIWYNLTLVSEERQALRVPVMRSELGKVEQYEVLLENPTSKEVIANTISTNPANFEVMPETIVLAPYEQTPVYIRYIPSNLDAQGGEITIITKDIGKWEFLVFGQGIPPTNYQEKILTVGLNKDHSEVIHFKNPFKDTIQVIISLESEDPEALEVFKLLLKTKKSDGRLMISGMQQLQIPFSFTPREIRSYRCEVVIAMNDKIKWKYPMVGHTESFAAGPQALFKTKCRIPFIQEFRFQLPGMGFSSQLSRFSFEIKNINEDIRAMLDRCFKMKMLKGDLREGEDTLIFEARFNPMKPFKASVDLIIQRDIGGVWKQEGFCVTPRFPIQLEASPPDADDLIVITSPLQKTSSVSFKLTNRYKQFATFTATFTPNSDQEFTVSPKGGLLEPFGREGTQFIISFTPLEYGQIKQGKLVIETDEMYWSYNVKGTLPKYVPPVVKESKILNQIDQEQEKKLQHKPKNFIQNNLTLQSRKLDTTRNLSPPNNKTLMSTMNGKFNKTLNQHQSLRESKSVQGFRRQ